MLPHSRMHTSTHKHTHKHAHTRPSHNCVCISSLTFAPHDLHCTHDRNDRHAQCDGDYGDAEMERGSLRQVVHVLSGRARRVTSWTATGNAAATNDDEAERRDIQREREELLYDSNDGWFGVAV